MQTVSPKSSITSAKGVSKSRMASWT